jgi:hypothetical protein
MRRTAVTVLTALAVAPLAGCGPTFKGVTGVTVDDQHRPVLVIAPCDGKVGQVVLAFHDLQAEATAVPAERAWDAPEVFDAPFRFSPWGDHGGWAVGTPPGHERAEMPPPLSSSYSYSFHGMQSGLFEYSVTQLVQFSLDDLTSLRPGEVRFVGWAEPLGEARVVSESEFLRTACVRP